MSAEASVETVEDFRLPGPRLAGRQHAARARTRRPTAATTVDATSERALQRKLFDGGFAGICFPAEYGGLGLSLEHQRAFTQESLPYDMPSSLNVPTLGILAADAGRLRHRTSRSCATCPRS